MIASETTIHQSSNEVDVSICICMAFNNDNTHSVQKQTIQLSLIYNKTI